MDYQQNPIWKKLDAFPFDAPNLIETFPDRLAQEGNWTKEFTSDIIREFKRFLLLITIKPEKLLVPSPPVALVWEMYEGFYPLGWQELCTQTLQLKLHLRNIRYEEDLPYNWLDEYYADTLNIYANIFQQAPPKKIWPPVEELPASWQIKLKPGSFWKQASTFKWALVLLFIIVALAGKFYSGALAVFILLFMGTAILVLFVRSGGRDDFRPQSYYYPPQK